MKYPDRILHQVSKPARYTGGEWNAVSKDWNLTRLKIALSYPDVYEIGMSNMAIGILYELFNAQPEVLCERVFTPWTDMMALLRREGLPLVSLESGRPLDEFDVIGFSLGYELTFTNVLAMLDLSRIPLFSSDRDDRHPLVIGGGSSCYNPEPVADFFDLFVIGEAETLLPRLIELFKENRGPDGRICRKTLLRQAADLPGIYIPSFYEPSYQEGRFQGLEPVAEHVPAKIRRQLVDPMPEAAVNPIVPNIEIIHDRAAVEISRGCSRGCRFCNAGIIYRPVRERPVDAVLKAVGEVIANTGYDEVSLVSLSSGDYSEIKQLVSAITAGYGNSLAISLPSLRLDEFAVNLVDALPNRRKSGLTFAPEAGSPRLQKVINKYIPEEELLAAAESAFRRGWTGLKLYFMLGLPTETEADVEGIVQLVRKVQAAGRAAPNRAPQVRLSLSTFVPKPHTPFQWEGQESESSLIAKHALLKNQLGKRGVKMNWQDTRVSLLEAVMSRGDRRLSAVIHRAWSQGAVFDGWSECFDFDIWREAFAECGLDPSDYAHRQRSTSEPLPWSHIDIGVTRDFLIRERQKALNAELTSDCRNGCNACGMEGQECP